jgi:hypothetical protein
MASITGASRLAAVLTLDLKPFLRNTEIARTKLAQFTQQAQALGSSTLRSVAVGLGLVGAASLSVATNFNELSTQLRAIGQGKEIEAVIDKARFLGRTTKFTATEVLKMGLELKKLGFSANDVSEAMDVSSKLSQIFGGSLEKVATTIAETQRQFKSASGEVRSFAEVGDIFAVAFQNSALDITNIGGALKNVASVANQANYSIERTVALLGTLANNGQKAERGGTRLKTALIRLGQKFGFTEDQVRLLESGMLDTAQIFDLLKNRAGLVGAIFEQNTTETKLLEQQLLDAKGALDAMNSALGKELFISVARVKAGFEDLGIEIGESLAPYVKIAADGVEALATAFAEASPATKDLVANLVIMGTVMPVIITLIGGLVAGVLALFTGPGAIVAVLTALAGAWVYSAIQAARYADQQENVNATLETFNDLAKEGANFETLSTPALQQLLKNTESAIEDAKSVLERAKDESADASRATAIAVAQGVVPEAALDDPKIDSARQKAQSDLNKLIAREFQLKKALKERQDLLVELADEQVRLSEEYGASLGFNVQLVQEFQDAWSKSRDKIAEAFAEFGFAIDDLDAVKKKIEDITNFSLTRVLEQGVPKDFLEGLLGRGTLEEQKKLAEALAKELTSLGVEAAANNAVDFAKYYEEAANVYEKFVEQLERKIKLTEIRAARDEAFGLAEALRSIGVITEQQNIQDKLSALNTQLRDLINNGGSAKAIRDVSDEISLLGDRLKRLNLAEKLKEAFRVSNIPSLDLLNTLVDGVVTKASELTDFSLDRLGAQLDALYSDFVSGGETTLQEILDLLGKIRDFKLLRGSQSAFEAYEDDLIDLRLAFSQIDYDVATGLTDRQGAAAQRLSIYQQELELLKELSKNASAEYPVPNEETTRSLELMGVLIPQVAAELKDLENATAITGFLQSQIDFLGQAFLAAAQNGENFFSVLKKSFLDTFYAIVAKLITLIALYGILAVLSNGSTVGAGGLKGAAAAATEGGLGTFLGSNLIGLNRSLASSNASVSGGTSSAPGVRVMGAISGNNLVIMNDRGRRAYDRTFG